jgi:hypothetical protein
MTRLNRPIHFIVSFAFLVNDEKDKIIDWLCDELVEKEAHAWGVEMTYNTRLPIP